MSTNFTFLKTVDKNLFEIISDAEKLYRDEYFEQCIGQTRRFAESVCKNVLGERYTGLTTFDEIDYTVKELKNILQNLRKLSPAKKSKEAK